MKQNLHTLPLHIGDFMRDTMHLNHEQLGVYFRLLLVHFTLGKKGIPMDRMPVYARVTAAQWTRKFGPAIEPLFTKRGNFLVSQRMVATLQDLHTRTQNQRAKALKRWETPDATAMPAENQSPNTKQQTPKEIENNNKDVDATPLYEHFAGVQTAEEFIAALPPRWRLIATSHGIEEHFIAAVAAGFWERFVGRYPNDPLLQEKFPHKKNWDKAWEFECDRLDRIRRGLPPRQDLPMQQQKRLKQWQV